MLDDRGIGSIPHTAAGSESHPFHSRKFPYNVTVYDEDPDNYGTFRRLFSLADAEKEIQRAADDQSEVDHGKRDYFRVTVPTDQPELPTHVTANDFDTQLALFQWTCEKVDAT